MSSDEDIDEDALLQLALEEQAHRNIDYKRSNLKSAKPVVNLVRPPPPPHYMRNQRNPLPKTSNPNTRQGKKDHSMDDDDSEVELLSISSGDDDSSKDQGIPGRKRDLESERRGGKDNHQDRGWDGTEPTCWKHVDEAELGRRVREMRETRTIPVVQTFERKGAVTRKALNHLQSLPRGIELVDPLGLGVIDNRTAKLITDDADSSPAGPRDKNVLDQKTREKLMYFSENFDAKLFLSRIHQDTSAADLEAGAKALKSDLTGRTQQRKQLVKENFDCFVSCKTTIDDIESKLRRIEEDPEGAGTTHLFNCIQDVSALANRAFGPLFERQAQAEKIRSVQGMLQRFRTLFNLPSAIRGSISKGEYDLAVREYRKAKSIVLPSHVGILKRVLEEVEKVIQEFRSKLYRSMEDPQIELPELENIIRLLLELEPDSDPMWHYLNIQNDRIQSLLERCSLDHEARMESLLNEIQEKALSNSRWRQIQQETNKSADVNYSVLLGDSDLSADSQPIDLNGEEVDALRGRYIRRLTAVVIQHIPGFWRLSLSVFMGKFAKVSAGNLSTDQEVNGRSSSFNRNEEKVGDVKHSSNSLDEVSGMIINTLSIYQNMVRNTFHDLEESHIHRSYMSDAIKEVSKACQAFEGKETAPLNAVSNLRNLHSEMIKIYISRLCLWMRTTTEEISKDEVWVPVSSFERKNSPYTITFLPLSFGAMLASAMDQITVMIQSIRTEAMKSEEIYIQVQEIQESVRLSFFNCFLDFAGYLEQRGVELLHNKFSTISQNGYFLDTEGKARENGPGSITDSHKMLLMVLSNIGYCKDQLSHELYDKYKGIWMPSREKDEEDPDIRDLVMSFSSLEEKVLSQYTVAKANMIRDSVASYFLDPGIQWGGAPTVKGVRATAVELLHTFVSVHSEVFSNAKPLLEKIMGTLVEALIDTFINLFHANQTKELKALDANGFCQLMLELEYFETVLHAYFMPDSLESLKNFQGLLLEKACESIPEPTETLGNQRRSARGGEETFADETTISPDDLIALAQQYSSELLPVELERTRINICCFMKTPPPVASVPQYSNATYSPVRASLDSPSRNFRNKKPSMSPSVNRPRRR